MSEYPITPFIKTLEKKRYARLQALVDEAPEQGDLWLKLGHCARSLGYFPQAVEAYQKARNLGCEVQLCRSLISILKQSYEPTALSDEYKPTPFLLYDDFLDQASVDEVWRVYQLKAQNFHDACIEGDIFDQQVRFAKAINLRKVAEVNFFKEKVSPLLEAAYQYFDIAKPKKTELAIELTSHTNNGFYDIHNDVNPKNPVRKLSYIYYFHQPPRAFKGGELHLHDTYIDERKFSNKLTSIDPTHNRLIIFPSHFYHKVCKVVLDGDDLDQGRHTLNGWHSDAG